MSAPVSAHIDLESPSARAAGLANANLDEQPCGQRSNGRIAERASVFRPGESIDVVWDVYVQHPSYFRLAFDLDGDDSFTALTPELPSDDGTSRPSAGGQIVLDYLEDDLGSLSRVEHTITLPAEPCELCTLQLTQVIYGVPIQDGVYYQCADITLEGEAVPPPVDAPGGPGMDAAPPEVGCTFGSAPARARAGAVSTALLAMLARLRRRRSRGDARRS